MIEPSVLFFFSARATKSRASRNVELIPPQEPEAHGSFLPVIDRPFDTSRPTLLSARAQSRRLFSHHHVPSPQRVRAGICAPASDTGTRHCSRLRPVKKYGRTAADQAHGHSSIFKTSCAVVLVFEAPCSPLKLNSSISIPGNPGNGRKRDLAKPQTTGNPFSRPIGSHGSWNPLTTNRRAIACRLVSTSPGSRVPNTRKCKSALEI